MSSFRPSESQAYFARTIALGPKACPEGLFSGDAAQVLRGLKVHANTISHARLLALEDSFPRTRNLIGHDIFNARSHSYFDAGHGRGQSLDRLGTAFPRWLEMNDTLPLISELARFEWLWLESYHARDAPSLTIAQMAELGAAALSLLRLRAHPAAFRVPCSIALADLLDLPGDGDWLLVARPDAEVCVNRIDHSTAALFAALSASETLFAAIETFQAVQTDKTLLAAMEFLLSAGVLTRGED